MIGLKILSKLLYEVMRKTNLQSPQLNLSDFQDKSLLIFDDDDPLRGRLSRAMEKKVLS